MAELILGAGVLVQVCIATGSCLVKQVSIRVLRTFCGTVRLRKAMCSFTYTRVLTGPLKCTPVLTVSFGTHVEE